METISLIISDLKRIEKPSIVSFLKWYIIPKGTAFPFQVWYRLMYAVNQNRAVKYTIGVIVYLKYCRMERRYGISLDSHIKIGYGLKIVHSQGTFINCEQIGNNFTIYQNVTTGYDTQLKRPVVEDNVTIYPGAVVTGGIVLHSGCTIGCNSYVHHDVRQNSLVAGLPAKEINPD